MTDKDNTNKSGHQHIHSDAKKEALRRISIAQGHLEKVKRMLEEDEYCPHIIHQSQAVQAAVSWSAYGHCVPN